MIFSASPNLALQILVPACLYEGFEEVVGNLVIVFGCEATDDLSLLGSFDSGVLEEFANDFLLLEDIAEVNHILEDHVEGLVLRCSCEECTGISSGCAVGNCWGLVA